MHAESSPRPAGEGDHALADLATRQHGVLSRPQLLGLGLGRGAIAHRIKQGRLHPLHSGVYLLGHRQLSQRGHWLAAVLVAGEGAVLSHSSAAALWGLVRPRKSVIDVTAPSRRAPRAGIRIHRSRVHSDQRATVAGIPVTTVARTLFDLAEVIGEQRLGRAWEEADRLNLLRLSEVESACERGFGRRSLPLIHRLLSGALAPTVVRSQLEERFAAFCHEHGLPSPVSNVSIEGREVDVFWPRQRLIVELDGFAFHGHRAAFERDRQRDAALQAAGYRVIRLTHRRLEQEPTEVATELRLLLGAT